MGITYNPDDKDQGKNEKYFFGGQK